MITKGKKDAIKLLLNNFIIVLDKNSVDNFEEEVGLIQGTFEYLAPEILNSRHELPNCSKQDIWAIGIIAYQLCAHKLPFDGGYSSATVQAIINNPLEPITQSYSTDLKGLINLLLKKDPE